ASLTHVAFLPITSANSPSKWTLVAPSGKTISAPSGIRLVGNLAKITGLVMSSGLPPGVVNPPSADVTNCWWLAEFRPTAPTLDVSHVPSRGASSQREGLPLRAAARQFD